MYKTDVFISAEEIKEIVGISKSKAYSLIQELNAELKEKGYLTVTGRVRRKHFEERFYGLLEKEQEEMDGCLQGKKRGTWYTSFPYVDWTGKRCRKLKRGFLTKKEAQNWENHFKLQKANSLDMTFEDFYGIYEADVKPKIRYNTWCTKEHIIKTKILPYFKNLCMRDITPRDIIKWQNMMRESINNKGKEYTGTYLKTVQAQLSSIFNHAVRFYELPNNPVRVAGPMGQNQSDEMKFWTKEEYMKFIPTMANKTYSYMAFESLMELIISLYLMRSIITSNLKKGNHSVEIRELEM